MAFHREDMELPIERRYGATAAAEWDLVLRRVSLATGFALILLIVPDKDGAALCGREMERFLAQRGKKLWRLQPNDVDDLRQIANPLLLTTIEPDIGAIWLSAVVSSAAPDQTEWAGAMRYALATLNQQRNPLRRQLKCPLIIVGAGWVVPEFREIAPDLWSVRSEVVRIEPDPAALRTELISAPHAFESIPIRPNAASADLDLALAEIARLRGVAGREQDLATVLERAGAALAQRGDFAGAEVMYHEAVGLRLGGENKAEAGKALHELAHTVYWQGRAAAAEDLFRQSLILQEDGGGDPASRGHTLHFLGLAVRAQGRAAEAEELLSRSLLLDEEGGATAVSRGITLHYLGWIALDDGRFADAEQRFRQSLALTEERDDTQLSRSSTLDGLAQAVRAQGRPAEAESLLRQSLALAEGASATAIARGITLDLLGRVVADQGRTAEAEVLFRHSLSLAEEGGDTAISRGITHDNLGCAVLDQGRVSEAEALFRQSLALKEEGDATAASRAITLDNLVSAVRAQGRFLEAWRLSRRARALRSPANPRPWWRFWH
jgi:tetratricopeptide (TPR) repeat protein